jgi:hypothetical protein
MLTLGRKSVIYKTMKVSLLGNKPTGKPKQNMAEGKCPMLRPSKRIPTGDPQMVSRKSAGQAGFGRNCRLLGSGIPHQCPLKLSPK